MVCRGKKGKSFGVEFQAEIGSCLLSKIFPKIMIFKNFQALVVQKLNLLSSESIWTWSDMPLLVQQIQKPFSFFSGSAFNYRDTIILNIFLL